MITKYENYCLLCGKPRTEVHHLIMGGTSGRRQLSEADDLKIPLCNKCHEDIHHHSTSNALSKVLGQMAWEKNYYQEGGKEDARELFRKRYGKSYI